MCMIALPKAPKVSSLQILYIGGINSSGSRYRTIEYSGYECRSPFLKSDSFKAYTSKFLPSFLSNVFGSKDYFESLIKDTISFCKDWNPDLIIGSSQGGAVAMEVVKNYPNANLMLLAPAWNIFNVKPVIPQDTIIIHGNKDWLISVDDSKYLASKNKSELIVVNDDHPLSHSNHLIIDQIDKISIKVKKHKSKELIKKEEEEYRKFVKEYTASIKNFSPDNFIFA